MTLTEIEKQFINWWINDGIYPYHYIDEADTVDKHAIAEQRIKEATNETTKTNKRPK